ncbi:PulJ/GspJ family protein [Coraliomargarita parva]|uniref:PulJ/GspJ family protein n=1 Tax=Coraliomargarita parva TaxID=3014050 RepID=UPI0022B57D7E|nr:type II secretion system protein [Coraliomargarita parva]
MRTPAPARPSSEAAFSLIEVIIAVAIFAMAATILTSTFVNALLAREKAREVEQLDADIQTVRLQLLLQPSRDDAEDGGECPTLNYGTATWRAIIEPTEVIDLFKVTFTIEFPEPPEGQAASHTEELYLLRPTWSESDERSDLLEDKRQELREHRDFGF